MTHSTFRAVVLMSTVLGATTAFAQPALGGGSCALSTNQASPFVGETFTANLTLTNTGTSAGFVPAAEVFVPTGLTLSSASAFGSALTVSCQAAAANPFTNPLTREVVTGPSGMAYCFIRYPLSSLAPAAGPQTATLTFTVATTASLTVPLVPQASCLFAFGSDALLNNSGDPVIRSDLPTSGIDQITSTSVQASVVRVVKTAPAPTASGPSFSTSWSISIDVATGVTLTGTPTQIHLTDTVPSSFQLTSITAPGSASISTVPITPGGAVDVAYASIVGVAGVDRIITLTGFVPRLDAANAEILSQSCAGSSTATLSNSATASGMRVTAGAPVVTLANVTTPTVSMQARAEVIRETVTNVTNPGFNFIPGQTGRVTLVVNVSDYFDLTSVSVASTLGAGVAFTGGSATVGGVSATPVVVGAEPTVLTFDLGALPGNESGGTRRTITYDFTVLETYNGAGRVHGGDVIATTNVLTSTVNPAVCTLTSNEGSGGSNASVQVLPLEQFAKSVYAITRGGLSQPVTPPASVQPGDIVTWRLFAVLPSGDQVSETIVDYLPSPLFVADEHGASPAFGSSLFRFGPSNTLPGSTTVTVAASGPSTNNAVTFSLSGFETLPSAPVTIDLLMDFTVQSAAQEDGVLFTNLASATVQGTGSTSTSASVVALVRAEEPILFTTLGVTRRNGAVNPGAFNGTYTTTSIAATPETANVTAVDAADTIEFTMIVENRGKQVAREVVLRNVPVAQLTSCTVPTVQTGGAAPVAIPGTSGSVYTAGGLSLGTYNIPATHPTSGANLVVIRFTCTLVSTVSANQVLTETAETLHYTNVPGGPNFVGAIPDQPTDSATITTRNFTLTKTLTSPTTPFSRTIQDLGTYTIAVTIPEGVFPAATLVDTLTPELAFTALTPPVLVLPAGVTCTSASCVGSNVSGTFNATGTVMTYDFGTLTNANTVNATAETISSGFSVVVLDVPTAIQGKTGVTNRLAVNLNGVATATVTSAAMNIIEPRLTLAHTLTQPTADSGDTVTVTTTITATNTTAYDVTYSITIPTGITPPASAAAVTATGGVVTVVGSLMTVTYPSISTGAANVKTISYDVGVQNTVVIGSTVPFTGSATWSTQPLTPLQIGLNPAAVERSNLSANGASYTATNTGNLTIKPFSGTNVLASSAIATIGDYVDFTVTVAISEGLRNSFEVTDLMPVGLAFVSADNLSVSGPVTCNAAPCVIPSGASLTNSNNGRNTILNFGTVNNTDTDNNVTETLSFTIHAAVTNVAAVVATSVLTNVVNIGTVAGVGGVAQSNGAATRQVTIREPTITSTTALSTLLPNAGDPMTVTVTLTSGGQVDTNELTTSTALTGMTRVAGSAASTCPNAVFGSPNTTTMTLASTPLPTGTSCTFTFNATVNSNITVGAAISAVSSNAWTSLPGVVTTSRSTYYTLAVERTGNTANPGGSANNYRQTSTGSTTAASSSAVIKTFVSTNNVATTGTSLAMGEDIVYRLSFTLQEGLNPLTIITDSPPPGLRLLSVALDTTGFAGTVGTNPTNAALNGTPGQAFSFALGTVTVTADNVTTNDTLSLLVTARAVLASASVDPTSSQAVAGSNAGTMTINGVAKTAGAASVDFVLPLAQVSVGVTPASIGATQVATLTGTLTNSGTGPLCDTTVTLDAPAGFTLVDPATDGLDNNASGVADEAAEATLLTAGHFVVPVIGCMTPTQTRAFPFRATAVSNIAPGTATFTATLGSYNTLPSSAGQLLNPAADFMDNNANGTRDEATDAVFSSSVTVVAPVIVFSKTITSLDGGVPSQGDLATYTITAQNTGTASTTGVAITDTLPTTSNTVIAGSESITPSGGGRSVSLTGTSLSATLGTLAPADVVTVKVNLQLAAIIDNGVTISNQANLTTTDGYGPRVSNDPATVAVDDATVLTISVKPRLALGAQPTITSANVAAYAVGGTCSNGSGDGAVTVTLGTVTSTVPCTAGAFSTTLDVSAVADAANLTVSASQTNPVGTSTDSKQVLKDTVSTVAFSTPAAGTTVAPNPSLTGLGEVGATVTVKEGATTLCTVVVAADGSWSCTTTLAIGSHSLTATAVDALGNLSPVASRTFIVDLVPVVVVNTPAVITAANVGTYPVSGTCTIGAGSVTITVGGTVTATTACTASGTFSTSVDVSSLADAASVTVQVAQTNTAGTGTDSKSVKKDTQSSAPVILLPANGSTVAANPTLSGTSEANATVTVSEGATTVCTATANASGAWSCASSLGLGSHTITATQVDASGNPSGPSAADSFTIVATPAVTLDAPGAVNAANVSAYALHGTCVDGAGSVLVTIGSVTTSTTCSGGVYSATVDLSSMSDVAPLTVTATQSNSVGTSTDSKTTLKDTTSTVAIVNPGNGTTVAPSPILSGTTEPGSTVTVKENGVTVCIATGNSAGLWSCASTLGQGAHTIDAIAVDTAGNVSSAAHDTFTVAGVPVVVISTLAVINSSNVSSYPVSGTCTAAAMTVTVSLGGVTATTMCQGDGTFSTTLDVSSVADVDPLDIVATQSTPAGTGSDTKSTVKDTTVAPPVITGPASGSTVAANPGISGSAEPGATVTVREGTTVICTASANSAGQWSCASSLGAGAHTITATQTDVAGNPSTASTPDPFTVAVVPVVVLNTPGTINALNAMSTSLSGTCTAGEGDVTIVAGSVRTTTVCTSDGHFSLTVDVSGEPQGALTVTASQTNLLGTGSDAKPTTVDTLIAVPVITGPVNGSTVADNPTLSGTAEPGSHVTVREGTAVVCTALTDSSGHFECNSTLGLGMHTVTATQVDAAGNTSAASSPDAFTVAAVPTVTISMLPVVTASNVEAYPVTGSCTVGSGSVTVVISGVTVTGPCEMGMYSVLVGLTGVPDASSLTVTASQTNALGTGTSSATTSKDATRPVTPVITGPGQGSTNAETPEITGTSEPGSKVDVTIDGTLVGTATADADGHWSLTPPEALPAGAHTVSATARDEVGNTSAASTDVEFVMVDGGFAPSIGVRGGGCAATGETAFAALAMLALFAFGRRRPVRSNRDP